MTTISRAERSWLAERNFCHLSGEDQKCRTHMHVKETAGENKWVKNLSCYLVRQDIDDASVYGYGRRAKTDWDSFDLSR